MASGPPYLGKIILAVIAGALALGGYKCGVLNDFNKPKFKSHAKQREYDRQQQKLKELEYKSPAR